MTAKKLIETVAARKLQDAVHREGARNSIVRDAQSALIALGYLASDSLTGYFGPKTKEALAAFQRDAKLVTKADDPNAGVLGPKTRDALVRARAERELQTTALKRGDRSEAVRDVQKLLVQLGYFSGPATGFYGEQTEAAVRRAQYALGLIRSDADLGAGMVGPVTKEKLAAAASERVAVAGEEME